MTHLTIWSLGMAYTMADLIGIKINNDENIRFGIVTTPAHTQFYTTAIQAGECDNNGKHISYTLVEGDHSIAWCKNGGIVRSVTEYILSPRDYASLCVDLSQPRTLEAFDTTRCLSRLLHEDKLMTIMNQDDKLIQDDTLTSLPYGVAAMGLFGIGYAGYRLYKSKQNQTQNHPSAGTNDTKKMQ